MRAALQSLTEPPEPVEPLVADLCDAMADESLPPLVQAIELAACYLGTGLQRCSGEAARRLYATGQVVSTRGQRGGKSDGFARVTDDSTAPRRAIDDVLERLASIVQQMRAEPVPGVVAHEVKRRILDTIGIALAGIDEPSTRMSRAYATASPQEAEGATILGTDRSTSPELATFANGTAMHSQDYMDTYLSPSGEACHPADVIPGVLALGEHLGSDPTEVIRAVTIAYEVSCRLSDAGEIRSRGWDSATYVGIAAACASASLLNLQGEALRAAISLATVPNVALRQTRNGEISMWKASAPASAVQNGVRAARMAAFGFRGPSEPFTGLNGFERRVAGALDRATLVRDSSDPHAILRTHIKHYPTQYHTQAGIEAALAVRGHLERPVQDDPVGSITIAMSRVCRELTADTPNKWDPQTRETADHSMPYLVVLALRDGELRSSDFEPGSFRDAGRLSDMAKLEVQVDGEIDGTYPERLSVRVELTQASGARSAAQIDHPLGHAARPMSDAEVEEKYARLAAGHLGDAGAATVADMVWNLERIQGVRQLSRATFPAVDLSPGAEHPA